MWGPGRGLLGAALAAVSTNAYVTRAEPIKDPAGATDKQKLADIVARAKKVLADGKIVAQTAPRQAHIWVDPGEETRARAILDRYYTISAEAVAANVTITASNKEATPQPAKKKKPRTPPSSIFEDFDTTAISGPYCKRYVICGGGTAAWSAIESMLEIDPSAAKDILLITDEEHYPYNRTVLSKELWEDDKRELFRSEQASKDAVEYAYKTQPQGKVSIIRGKRVSFLDVDEKRLTLSDSSSLHYDKLLLATGGSPKSPGYISAALASPDLAENVSVFRTLEDYKRLQQGLKEKDLGAVVIGGGFLGTELAISLASTSQKVSLVVAEAGVLYKVLPRYVCEYLARRLSEIGVNVIRSAIVTGASKRPGTADVVTLDIASPDADHVEGNKIIVAVGIDPDVSLAMDADLEVDDRLGGIRVNDFMMVEPDVFAAGDVASFHDRGLGRRRVEHWDHAVVSGRIAGKNMMGQKARYGFQSMFWSDLTNIGVSFTAVGLVDSTLETLAVWNLSSAPVNGAPSANSYTSGVVYFVKNSEIVGAVLWNPKKGSGSLRRARALISAKTRVAGLSQNTLAGLVNLEESSHRTTIRTNPK